MPDDHHLLMPRRNPEDIDLGAIKADLEFIMERLSKLPRRQELALRPLLVIAGSAYRRKRRARHRLDRVVSARLSLNHWRAETSAAIGITVMGILSLRDRAAGEGCKPKSEQVIQAAQDGAEAALAD